MFVPTALADTVTPASLSPDAEAMVPLSSWSAACADVAKAAAASTATHSFDNDIMVFPRCARSTGSGSGDGFQIRDDGVDLGAAEIVLEARHARRPVADDPADYVVVAAGGFPGQLRAIGARAQRRR